jgi:hypothetical protein
MSEDVDLKIVSTEQLPRQEYRKLRDTVTEAPLKVGFQCDPGNPLHRESGNASRYTLYRLPYSPIIAGEGTLRPEIQIETAIWLIRRPTVQLSVISFSAEVFNDPPEVPTIPCVALSEMIAEKFVAFTRRAGAELAKAGSPRDPTLVRHIYDLHMTRSHYKLNEVAEQACEITLADVKAYGHQFPAYRLNPIGETLRAVKAFATDSTFADRYETFQRDMVYGERADFAIAVDTVLTLAKRIKAVKARTG